MNEEKRAREVFFSAGRQFTSDGRPSSYWSAVVAYAWNPYKGVFHVYVEQTLGTGSVYDSVKCEYDEPSVNGVNSHLASCRELERHFREVYGSL